MLLALLVFVLGWARYREVRLKEERRKVFLEERKKPKGTKGGSLYSKENKIKISKLVGKLD